MPIIKKKAKQANPAKMLTLSLLAVIAVGTVLLCLPCSSRDGSWTNIIDCFFTAASATTTTGITVVDTYWHWNLFGQVLLLIMTQVGGLGLVIILTFFNFALGRKMGLMKASAIAGEVSTNGIVGAKRLFIRIGTYTLIMEGIGAVIMAFTLVPQFGGYGIFMSVFTSISAFCNGGLDLFNLGGGLSSYSDKPQVHIVIAALVFLGGIGFVVWDNVRNYFKTKRLSMHTKLVLIYSAVLFVAGFLAYFLVTIIHGDMFEDMSIGDRLFCSAFTSVSARSAGFNIRDIALANDFSKLLTILLMFIGSAPASTGGGIRVTTLAILIASVMAVLKGQEDAKIWGHRVRQSIVFKAIACFVLSFGFIMLCFAVIYLLNPTLSEVDILYEIVSAFTTTGFSTGVSAQVDPVSKLVLSFAMLAGRVGPVSLLLSFTSDKNDDSKSKILPECEILIG
ncbi:MAG: potassium transporter Trk [Firmicutes bacterium]|nr:potassium transporter Trk [[Eubacterium] siraeum]MCM1487909.1 potassium transporter Trk [Bacillota bacterium]